MGVKRAHMVTRGYLRAWSNKRNLVYVWDYENRIAGVRPVGDATVVRFAYRAEIVQRDLEADFMRIEDRGLPALRSFADGGSPNEQGQLATIEFLDMHLDRGRYADQASVKIPAAVVKDDGSVNMVEMGLGDRLTLANDLDKKNIRLRNSGLLRKRWRIMDTAATPLLTGDGAVLVFTGPDGVDVVAFPLSPTRLLVIGDALDGAVVPINELIATRSKRWLVDQVDGAFSRTLTFAPQ